MLGKNLILYCAIFISVVYAVPSPEASGDGFRPPKPCRKVGIRKSWHKLSVRERSRYIDAVRCLQTKKGKNSEVHPGIGQLSAYEDFVWEHKNQALYVHGVGHFLPWHRYMVYNYEKALREKCDYDGYQPYWDYRIDANNFNASIIWQSFGGNGAYIDPATDPNNNPNRVDITGGGCVTTGPFRSDQYRLRLGRFTSLEVNDRCLERSVDALLAKKLFQPQEEEAVLAVDTNYYDFWIRLDTPNPGLAMHQSGHISIGGNMNDPFMSPAEPLFYLHHANIDRIWRTWQAAKLKSRLFAIGGTDAPFGRPPPPGVNNITITLDYPITIGKSGKNTTVGEIMDTRAGHLCYDYDSLV